jgi:ATP-dependent Zn protease
VIDKDIKDSQVQEVTEIEDANGNVIGTQTIDKNGNKVYKYNDDYEANTGKVNNEALQNGEGSDAWIWVTITLACLLIAGLVYWFVARRGQDKGGDEKKTLLNKEDQKQNVNTAKKWSIHPN